MDNRSFCPAPWISKVINGDSVLPCFVSEGNNLKHKFMDSLKPAECNHCWRAEDSGILSFRQKYIKRVLKARYDIDIDVINGDVDDYYSHLEYLTVNGQPEFLVLCGENENYFDHITSDIREVEIVGSDPFTSSLNKDLIIKLSSVNANIDKLHITTDGMTEDKELIDALSKFRRVKIVLSSKGDTNVINKLLLHPNFEVNLC